MFRRLGDFLSRWWFVVLGAWIVAFAWLRITAPPFDEVAKAGEFNFLPDSMQSRQSELLFRRAFPERQATSNIVVVAHRDSGDGLTDLDRTFITDHLTPAMSKIRDETNQLAAGKGTSFPAGATEPVISELHDFSDPGIGALLTSDDRKASLVTLDLNLDFQDTHNWIPIQKVEAALHQLAQSPDFPAGLQLALTGSAVLGRDLTKAEADSARKTGPLTVGLVVILLAVIYRAPLLALIPLTTLFVAVGSALNLLTLLGERGYVPLFRGLQEYTTVISYGPGIDYCLFLIARYKENLRACIPPREALAAAIGQVGHAIVASAATVICGIGMLSFAQFGKFHEAGVGISIALAITLVAVLTLTPALLFVAGHWAFWPLSGERCKEEPAETPVETGVQSNFFQPLWHYMGGVIERHPMRVLLSTTAAMIPFIFLGLSQYTKVSYGLIESLPKTSVSAQGAKVLEEHFPAGITGPIQVLLQDDELDFSSDAGIALVQSLVTDLMKQHRELSIADIRSVADPLGAAYKAKPAADESFFSQAIERKNLHKRGIEFYVASTGPLTGHVTELQIIPTLNPFSMDCVHSLDRLMTVIQQDLPASQKGRIQAHVLGPTASVRDVSRISYSDQWRIDLLVVSSVLVILMILLRTIAISIYLILTVLMSYIATLGSTWLLFYAMDPKGFIGLDWTVPLFLFVVLIAIGEDYNIFLVTRVHEEQARHGARKGIVDALTKTGGIITSCGFIMAGTFLSLFPNALVRMQQLGFALAFGVMLDTFVVRPILVPAFLMVLNDERYGNLARYVK